MGRGAGGVGGAQLCRHWSPDTQAKGQGPHHSGWGWPVHCVPPPQLCPVSQTLSAHAQTYNPGPGSGAGTAPTHPHQPPPHKHRSRTRGL